MVHGVREYATNAYYTMKKLAINIQNLAVSEASGGLYCNCNIHGGTETYPANLTFI